MCTQLRERSIRFETALAPVVTVHVSHVKHFIYEREVKNIAQSESRPRNSTGLKIDMKDTAVHVYVAVGPNRDKETRTVREYFECAKSMIVPVLVGHDIDGNAGGRYNLDDARIVKVQGDVLSDQLVNMFDLQ